MFHIISGALNLRCGKAKLQAALSVAAQEGRERWLVKDSEWAAKPEIKQAEGEPVAKGQEIEKAKLKEKKKDKRRDRQQPEASI